MSSLNEATQLAEQRSHEVEAFISSNTVVTIEDKASYDGAVDIAKQVRAKHRELEKERKSLVDPLRAVVKQINDKFKLVVTPLELFEKGINRVCGDFLSEQQRIQAEKQRAAEEEARKERARIEAAAAEKRRKEEAARRAEQEALRQAAAAENAKERARLQKEAERKRLAAEKAAAEASAKEEVAATVIAPVVDQKIEKKGVYQVETWKIKVKDRARFIMEMVQRGAIEYLIINESMLNREAQSTKGMRQWPGIDVVKNVDTRRRG